MFACVWGSEFHVGRFGMNEWRVRGRDMCYLSGLREEGEICSQVQVRVWGPMFGIVIPSGNIKDSLSDVGSFMSP